MTTVPPGTRFIVAVPNPARTGAGRPLCVVAPVSVRAWGGAIGRLAAEALTLEPRAVLLYCFGSPWDKYSASELGEVVRVRLLSARERLHAGLPLRKEDSVVLLPGVLLMVRIDREDAEGGTGA